MPDSTILSGIAFISHQHPFIHSSPTHNSNSNPFRKDQSANLGESVDGPAEEDAEGEAEMCLALEMVRHKPLALQNIIKDDGSSELDSGKGKAKERGKENGGLEGGRKVSYRSTGSIRM